MTRQYYGIESLSLTTGQRQTLVAELRTLGANNHAQPSHRNHWRTRPDEMAVIFEGEFNDDRWTVAAIRQRLANIFSVPLASITASTASTTYGPVVTISYNSTPRLRMIAFGGLLATWEQSHDQVLAYLAANLGAWEAENG